MALSESLCWEVLRSCRGQSVSATWFKGHETGEPPIQDALPLFVIEKELVLRHSKAEIEDSLYFLEKRGYLVRHGFTGLTRVVMQLSAAANEILVTGSFSPEEQQAFKESILSLEKTEFWGLNLSVPEMWRRFKKWRSKSAT